MEICRTRPQPRGEKRLCTAEPIDIVNELKPISVTKTEKGYLYDFGINTAGVCCLCVRGELDQRIELRHGEHLKDGLPDVENIWFKREHWARDLEYVHKDVYTCRGDGKKYIHRRLRITVSVLCSSAASPKRKRRKTCLQRLRCTRCSKSAAVSPARMRPQTNCSK